ncbi:MAG: hypothetical protein KGJ18_11170, partial [Gammaproteobacteria bacterium]|nr:hypothetical protein [Gammaproteobacteria bacterium]
KEGELQSSERVAKGALRRNARVARDGDPGQEYEAWIAPYSCNPGLSGDARMHSLEKGGFLFPKSPSFALRSPASCESPRQPSLAARSALRALPPFPKGGGTKPRFIQ